MALLLAILVGLLVGFISGYLLQRKPELLPVHLGLGVIGAILGDVFYVIASGNLTLLFSWGGVASQVVGAALFVFIYSLIHKAGSTIA